MEWEKYEEIVFDLFRSTGYYCERNVLLKGVRGSHQIDVLLHLDTPLKHHIWLIECKYKTRPVGKNDLQSFKTVIDDIGADHGYLVSESGFQKGAVEMAKTLNISLTSYSKLNEIFSMEQLNPNHRQSKTLFGTVKEEDDWGNMDSEATLELKSIENLPISDQLIEMHVFHEGNLHWTLSNEKCRTFISDSNSLRISIPWDLPNLDLEQIPLEKGGIHLTGKTKSGVWVCGSYNIVFRTFTGPVYISAYVPAFK